MPLLKKTKELNTFFVFSFIFIIKKYMKKKWNEEEVRFLLDNYKTVPLSELSKKLNRTKDGVKKQIHKLNIYISKWSYEEDELLFKEYPNKNIDELILLFPRRTKSSILNRAYNLKLKKNFNETIKYKKYKYDTNHNFFSDVNTINSYWAGFISADGWVESKNNSRLGIKLSKKDYNQLAEFKKIIQTESPITEKEVVSFGKNTRQVQINIYSNTIIKDLKHKFNIVDKKTLINVPQNLQEFNCKMAFIVGLFDGDGTIVKYKNNFRVSFLGTFEMLSWVKLCLEKLIGHQLKSNILKFGNVYRFGISNKPSLALIDWIRVNKVYCLNRKIGKYAN